MHRHSNADEQPDSMDTELPAAIHRRMGAAGGRLNDGHAHLSALRSAVTEDAETSPEVTEAELEALVHALEDAQQRLDEALDLATRAATGVSKKEDPASSETDVDDRTDGMLWNTAGVAQPPLGQHR